MKSGTAFYRLFALSFGSLIALQCAARADDTAEQIRLLKAQLRRLEQKVEAQEKKQKETQVQIRNVEARPVVQPAAGGNGIYVGPLGGPSSNPSVALQEQIRGLPTAASPSLFINGVSITPGGFLALETIYRTRFIGADIATPFQNIPFQNNRPGLTGEFRFSARQSRASLLAKGDVNPATHLAGYIEMDFLGAAQTANSNESNSYNPRIRHVYATLDQDDFGVHVLAGQTWSLITTNGSGITPRTEITPVGIEAQYVPGFAWARQPGIRVVKDFDKTFWFALSAENPATTVGGFTTVGTTAATLPSSLVYNVAAPGGSLFNSANSYTLNSIPDLIGKAAWDPTFADRHIHVEAFGIYRDFYDQVNNTGQHTAGGGFGGSILFPILPKTLDFQFSGMSGKGIGRYGSAQLPDVTFNSNGSIAPIHQNMLLAGLTWHATPDLDLYTYAGEEWQKGNYTDTFSGTTINAFGIGNPLFDNRGCFSPGSAGTCTGNIQSVKQITGGFWDKIYQGPFGQLRAGMQYSYTLKSSFAGLGGVATANENVFLGSIRYYPF